MENNTIDTIYESVVRIETNVISFNWLAPFIKSKSGIGSGTGFVIDELGHILTCFHVLIKLFIFLLLCLKVVNKEYLLKS